MGETTRRWGEAFVRHLNGNVLDCMQNGFSIHKVFGSKTGLPSFMCESNKRKKVGIVDIYFIYVSGNYKFIKYWPTWSSSSRGEWVMRIDLWDGYLWRIWYLIYYYLVHSDWEYLMWFIRNTSINNVTTILNN